MVSGKARGCSNPCLIKPRNPSMLLLDEPLGALDLKLRETVQEELKVLQKTLGITFILVTHDQSEALSMADRVAVFNDGRIMPIGTPQEIYQRPATRFVADFVGSSNVLPPAFVSKAAGRAAWASLRPEAIRIVAEGGHAATVQSRSFLGGVTRLGLQTERQKLIALAPSNGGVPREGDAVHIAWKPEDLHLMKEDLHLMEDEL